MPLSSIGGLILVGEKVSVATRESSSNAEGSMPRQTKRELDLETLRRGMPGMTQAEGGSLVEAAAVCLESQGHSPGVRLTIDGAIRHRLELRWTPANEQSRRSFRDERTATERAACAVALAIMSELAGLEVIERSMQGEGHDYWLAPIDGFDQPLFEDLRRLEVSGIRSGTPSQIAARSRSKLRQSMRARKGGRAAAVVVGFSRPLAQVAVA